MIAWIERKLRKPILVNLICIFVIFRTDNYMNNMEIRVVF